MKEKLNKKIVIIMVIVTSAIIIGTSFSIFIVKKEGNQHTYTTANLSLSFNDNTAIVRNTNVDPVYPEDVDTSATIKEFSVSNTGNKDLYVDLILENISLSTNLKNDLFKWKIVDVTNSANSLLNSGNFNTNNTSLEVASDILINSNNSKTFKLYVWLEENYSDQNTLQGLSFSSTINAYGYLKP